MEFDLTKPHCYWFNEISKIPHPSRHEKAISDFIVEFAKERGLAWKQDHVWNVIVEKPASAGYEDAEPIILQAHTDMVPAKVDGSDHNFETDPLKLYVDDEGWLHAEGTTLGDDDGHGVAYMLAILDDDELPHPLIQCYFTTMEEIGLLGAMELKAEDIKADRMISLDGGGETSTAISSAGGCSVYVHGDICWKENTLPGYELTVSGLKGGHSGGIDKEKGNAITIAARIIEELRNKGLDVHISAFSGGEKDNAIPRTASVVFASAADAQKLQEAVSTSFGNIRTELEFSDPDVAVTLNKEIPLYRTMHDELGNAVIDYAYLAPNGFQHKSMVIEGLTVTSLNLGVVTTGENEVLFDTLIRSAMDSASDDLNDKLHKLADILGLRYELAGKYSGWNYEPESPMRDLMKEIVVKYGGTYEQFAVHGGCECGVFKALNPKLDILTFGPIGTGAHTPEEKLNLASFDRSYEMLKEMVSRYVKKVNV